MWYILLRSDTLSKSTTILYVCQNMVIVYIEYFAITNLTSCWLNVFFGSDQSDSYLLVSIIIISKIKLRRPVVQKSVCLNAMRRIFWTYSLHHLRQKKNVLRLRENSCKIICNISNMLMHCIVELTHITLH